MKRVIGATFAVAACSVGFAAAAGASNGDKVSICHGTASDNNPYVLIDVSENAIAGHFDGSAPGHGKNSHRTTSSRPARATARAFGAAKAAWSSASQCRRRGGGSRSGVRG